MRLIFLFLLLVSSLAAQVKFEDYFFDKTMRFDYYETVDSATSLFSYDEIKEEPYWAGSKTNLLDTLEFGYYFFRIFDRESGKEIYSRGFSTLAMEWQTTAEAKKFKKTFTGSVVFPYPKKKVRLKMFKRNRMVQFEKVYEYDINPESYFVRKKREMPFDNFKVHYSGEPAIKLDIVLIPEGYSKEEVEYFKEECKKFAEYLFKYEPYKSHKENINIWGVSAYSEESGVDIPGDTVWVNSILNSNFYTFDSERYLMVEDFQKVRDVAANAPYDQIYILANTEKYGGGAIYNFYSVTATRNRKTEKIFIHELGHGLAGLADEYYTSQVSYENFFPEGVEPWEPNITTMVNFESKWKNLLDEDTPVPTPDNELYDDVLGVFEGGGYVAEGVFRPTRNSVMKALESGGYNLPSIKALEHVIKFYSR